MTNGLMKRAFIATIAIGFLLGPATADSYYFRSKGSPQGRINDSELELSASLSGLAGDYRVGAPISGLASASGENPAWTLTQSPDAPSLSLSISGGSLSGSAPAVAAKTTFIVVGRATVAGRAVTSADVSLTVHPMPKLSGGPVGMIAGVAGDALEPQPAFVLSNVIGKATYELLQNGAAVPSLGGLCEGLSFSSVNGRISGTPITTCSVSGLSVRASDSFDNAIAASPIFSITITMLPSNAYAWGINGQGALSDGTATSRPVPGSIMGAGRTYTKIATGSASSCGLLANGTVECWGQNSYGQVGDGTTTRRYLPVKVLGLSGASDIQAGVYHFCALTSGGAVKCWGRNDAGQIGDGSTANSLAPKQVSGLTSGVTRIFAAHQISCAIINGRTKCWGRNDYGQLGDGTTTQRPTPVDVTILSGVPTEIAADHSKTCAIVADALRCWGYSLDFLGDGKTQRSLTPIQVTGLTSGVTRISLGSGHSCAIANGAAKCWGQNGDGQVGDGTRDDKLMPVQVIASKVTEISAGASHTCAIVSGSVHCWGSNAYGQLGNGSADSGHALPRSVSGFPRSMIGISLGSSFSTAW